ncbi:MAG TPA: type II secretion system protein GspM [Longimicrobiaceae bacterium]|nr:type II secretion system protein GspM [Longimicrobiaceae bacterium]
MRWGALSPRDRRAAGVGGAVAAAALLFRFAVLPYAGAVEDTRTTLLRERERLARERALLSGARAYPEEFGVLGGRFLAGIPRLLPGGSVAAAQAALARRVDGVAAEGPVLLTRLEPLPARPARDGYLALPLQVEGESDLEGLLTLLAALESGPTLFHLENLAVERKGGIAPGTQVAGPEALAFRFTVVGFALEDTPRDTTRAPRAAAGGAR